MSRRRWSAVGGLWLVLLAVGCSGGDDSGESDAAVSASSTTLATSAPAPAEGIVALCPGQEFVDSPRSIALPRDLPDGAPEAVAAAALESVVAGLTTDDQSAGYLVPWPDGADVLRTVALDGDTLTVDFDPSVVDEYVAATGSSTRFFVPLVETAFRVPEVEHIEFVIDGSASEWNEWWQGDASTFDRTSWRDRRPEPETVCPA